VRAAGFRSQQVRQAVGVEIDQLNKLIVHDCNRFVGHPQDVIEHRKFVGWIADGVAEGDRRQRAHTVRAEQRHLFQQRPMRVRAVIGQVSEFVTPVERVQRAVAVEIPRQMTGQV
jgi:hypothetical protein